MLLLLLCRVEFVRCAFVCVCVCVCVCVSVGVCAPVCLAGFLTKKHQYLGSNSENPLMLNILQLLR